MNQKHLIVANNYTFLSSASQERNKGAIGGGLKPFRVYQIKQSQWGNQIKYEEIEIRDYQGLESAESVLMSNISDAHQSRELSSLV
jgi:hypothetical protein